MCFSGVAFPQLWSCLPQGCCWDWMQEDSWGSGWRDGEEAVLLVVTSGEGCILQMRAMGAPASAGIHHAVLCIIHCGLKELGQKF